MILPAVRSASNRKLHVYRLASDVRDQRNAGKYFIGEFHATLRGARSTVTCEGRPSYFTVAGRLLSDHEISEATQRGYSDVRLYETQGRARTALANLSRSRG